MNEASITLVKSPALAPARDFARLRRDGIGFIEKLGSRWWTDYNVHDPGITILEALCYAITDLAYRIDWKIEDILTPSAASADPLQPYPNQAFFSARQILTVNPVTPDDFRRLLIDLDKVRNAWVIGRECSCDASYWAWCEDDVLEVSHVQPTNPALKPVKVTPRGMYDALVELEQDPEMGDLNDRKLELRTVLHESDGAHATILELRFPDLAQENLRSWRLFLASDDDLADESRFDLTLIQFGATKGYNVFTNLATDAARDEYLRAHWKSIFYASFEVKIVASGEKIVFQHATLRLLSDSAKKQSTTMASLQAKLQDKSAAGFVRRYQRKGKAVHAAVASARKSLHAHRNLDEDYCLISTIGIEEVAVCADVEVQPGADIERIQARIWFEIEQCFNPSICFRTLQELLDAGESVESIFDGPELENGFISQEDLKSSALRGVVRTSDILNRLMDVDGVIAVNQLLLTKYDSAGHVVRGVADPTWVNGVPVFDPNRVSAAWLLFVSPRHAPRLYLNQSRFLFIKNGLPFRPRFDEATDTLNQLRGGAERPKNQNASHDLTIPKGTYRDVGEYFPIQYCLPQSYGISPEGLPQSAAAPRQAQAKQLQGYFAVFEQMFVNSLTQLAHVADLFSLDPAVRRTYFVKRLKDAYPKVFDDLSQATFTEAALQSLVETTSEFHERRNRFLDHLLARFGEDFSEFAILVANTAGAQVAAQRLIESKTAFLKRYPEVSHNRGKAFDYTEPMFSGANSPGIKKRVLLLLGAQDLKLSLSMGQPTGDQYPLSFEVIDPHGVSWLKGSMVVDASNNAEAAKTGGRTLLRRMVMAGSYEIAEEAGKTRLSLVGKAGAVLGAAPRLFESSSIAIYTRDALIQWSSHERLIVVEHLLLRPKFPGDALYPVCCEGDCGTCGDEDPYSFRLTFVMPGWLAQYTENLDVRGFATRTVQQETPSHLLGKVCWVGNDGLDSGRNREWIGNLTELLSKQGLTAQGVAPTPDEARQSAVAIHQAFRKTFFEWRVDEDVNVVDEGSVVAQLRSAFQAIDNQNLPSATVLTDSLWAEILTRATKHFVDVAIHGSQFDRFESAWDQWLIANAAIDWTDEQLLSRVQAMLRARLVAGPAGDIELCRCAETIVSAYGSAFYDWMRSNIVAGRAFDSLSPFLPPTVSLSSGMTFQAETAQAIAEFLGERYAAYRQVSYRLWGVVNLLGELRNVYPEATLHDCDDGSDLNPVRLDNTALGNSPLRENLS